MLLRGSVTAECMLISHFCTCFVNVRNLLLDEFLFLACCDQGEV